MFRRSWLVPASTRSRTDRRLTLPFPSSVRSQLIFQPPLRRARGLSLGKIYTRTHCSKFIKVPCFLGHHCRSRQWLLSSTQTNIPPHLLRALEQAMTSSAQRERLLVAGACSDRSPLHRCTIDARRFNYTHILEARDHMTLNFSESRNVTRASRDCVMFELVPGLDLLRRVAQQSPGPGSAV